MLPDEYNDTRKITRLQILVQSTYISTDLLQTFVSNVQSIAIVQNNRKIGACLLVLFEEEC